jgi:hypothetical protein
LRTSATRRPSSGEAAHAVGSVRHDQAVAHALAKAGYHPVGKAFRQIEHVPPDPEATVPARPMRQSLPAAAAGRAGAKRKAGESERRQAQSEVAAIQHGSSLQVSSIPILS